MKGRRPESLTVVVVILAAILVYLNSLSNGFAYDDDYIIRLRGLVHGLGNLSGIVTAPYWPEGFFAGLYRPLTLLSFAVDWSVWGGDPFGFHLLNVILHAGVTGLVAILLLQFFPWWACLAGGLTFAIHPVHTEAVANVVGRGELLATLFIMTATLVYVRAVREDGLGARSIAAIALAYLLASLSKEVGVVLPGLLLVTDLPLFARGRAGKLRDFLRGRLPLFAVLTGVLILVFAVRWAALGAPLQNQPDRIFALDASFSTRLYTMIRVWPRYFELLLFPMELSADYSPAIILPADQLTPLGAVGILLVLATIGVAVAFFRRAPECAMAVAWATIAILPVSNLVVMAEIVLAERTLYIPSIAVAIVTALLLTRASSDGRRLLVVGLGAWIVGFSAVTIRRNPVWESTDTVFENLRRQHPESSRLLYGVASQYYRQGDWERAREWFYKSLAVWPHHAPYLAEFALYLMRHDELAAADNLASRAVELSPSNRDYRVLLALIRVNRGEYQAAVETINESLDVLGDDATLYTLLSTAHAGLAQHRRAVEAQRAAVRSRKNGPTWNDLLGLAQRFVAVGDTASALSALQDARRTGGVEAEVADSLQRLWSRQPVPR